MEKEIEEKKQQTANSKSSSISYLDSLKQAYGNVHVAKRGFLFWKWYSISYKENGKKYSFKYPPTDPEKIFETEENLYKLVDSNMQTLIEKQQQEERLSAEKIEKHYVNHFKYQYSQKKDTHQIVEHMWASNAKTVDTVRKGRKMKHEVLPDNASDSYYSVQPYKKKKKRT